MLKNGILNIHRVDHFWFNLLLLLDPSGNQRIKRKLAPDFQEVFQINVR